METAVDDGRKGDPMHVRDLDCFGVEIGRVVQAALIVMITIPAYAEDHARRFQTDQLFRPMADIAALFE